MAAPLTPSPTSLTFYAIRDVTCRSHTQQLTISDDDATLSKVGSAPWLTIPATSVNGEPFDVVVDPRDIVPGYPRELTETIRATAAGFADTDIVVTVKLPPSGPAGKR